MYLSVCKDPEARLRILSAQTRRLSLAADVDLAEVAAALPSRSTGADIGSVVSAAYSAARARALQTLRSEALGGPAAAAAQGATVSFESQSAIVAHHAVDIGDRFADAAGHVDGDDYWSIAAHVSAQSPSRLLSLVSLRQEDLLHAARALQPSVSAEELRHYEQLAIDLKGVAATKNG